MVQNIRIKHQKHKRAATTDMNKKKRPTYLSMKIKETGSDNNSIEDKNRNKFQLEISPMNRGIDSKKTSNMNTNAEATFSLATQDKSNHRLDTGPSIN